MPKNEMPRDEQFITGRNPEGFTNDVRNQNTSSRAVAPTKTFISEGDAITMSAATKTATHDLAPNAKRTAEAKPTSLSVTSSDQIPHAPDSERAVIGGLLLDPSRVTDARERLNASFFYVPSSRLCYEAILSLTARGIALDPMQLVEELRARNTLDRVGGVAHVATFTDFAVRSDFEGHCKRVIDAATRRMLWVLTNRSAEAANSVQPVEEILNDLRKMIADAEARQERARPSASSGLVKSWADFSAEHFTAGERIAFAVERGEAVLVNALPNAGKTTLALNAAVSLAAGREFLPVVTTARERRVLYVDGETRRARLQRDLQTMTASLSRDEAMSVGCNLHIVCEAEIAEQSLALTRPDHWAKFVKDAIQTKPDFIVIDTMVSLCPVFNENDNAEQQRRIWTPLQKLARDCNAAVLVLHHVGKRSEDSQTPEAVYRGRGASASGGFARAVWLLIPDPVTPGLSTLKCVKAKGDTPAETRLQLSEGRWFVPVMATIARPKSALERVLDFVTVERRTAEIEAALNPDFRQRAVQKAIAEAVELGKLLVVKKGVYKPASAQPAQSAQQLFADTAGCADSNAIEAQNTIENDNPHNPHSSIGSADCADSVTTNKDKDLGEIARNPQKLPVRKSAEVKTDSQKPVSARAATPMASTKSRKSGRERYRV